MLTTQISNSFGLWLACLPVLLVVAAQAFLIWKKAKAASPLEGLTPEEQKAAFSTGFITALGPSISGFILVMSLQAIVGSPVALQRISIISSPYSEFQVTQFTAAANGVNISEGFPLQIFAAALFVLALNGCGWMLFCLLFTDKMNVVTAKLSGGSAAALAMMSVAAMLGIVCYMGSGYALASKGNFLALFSAIIARLIIDVIAKKVKGLSAWALPIAMIIGLAVGELLG